MAKRPLYIAAYDVANPARLRRALREVKAFATGGQKSVYECYLHAPEHHELVTRMHAVLDPNEDRFMLLRLETRGAARILGIAVPPADPDYFYVG